MIRLEVEVPQRYRLSFDKKRVRQVLSRAGQEIAAVARRKVRRAVGGGRQYGAHQASAPGEAPVNLSGKLAASIRARPFKGGDGVMIRDTELYALFLEKGAKGGGVKGRRNSRSRKGGVTTVLAKGSRVLLPRPFLSTALAERQASIEQRVKDAIIGDIEFRRISAAAKV
jgi:hypothetical protein